MTKKESMVMSRSRKRTPVHGWTSSESEKADKKLWHSRMRARERQALHRGDEVFPEERDVSNPRNMAKDGQGRWEYDDEWDEEKKDQWRRIMRK